MALAEVSAHISRRSLLSASDTDGASRLAISASEPRQSVTLLASQRILSSARQSTERTPTVLSIGALCRLCSWTTTLAGRTNVSSAST